MISVGIDVSKEKSTICIQLFWFIRETALKNKSPALYQTLKFFILFYLILSPLIGLYFVIYSSIASKIGSSVSIAL